MDKYYFILYREDNKRYDHYYIVNDLINKHPLQWQIENRNYKFQEDIYERTLLSWKEIAEEEYNKFENPFNDY